LKKGLHTIDVAKQLAVQSWCFRGFKDNAVAIERVKAIRREMKG